jgi:hypothetical protein
MSLQRRYFAWIVPTLMLVAVSVLGTCARAQSLGTYVRTYVHGLDKGTGVPTVENEQLNGAPVNQNISTFAPSATSTFVTSFSGGTGDARGYGGAGLIRAYSSTFFPHTNTTDYIETDTRVNVVDRGTITAPGLQVGDAVTMQFSMIVDGLITPDPSLFFGAGGSASAYFVANLTIYDITRNSVNPLYLQYMWNERSKSASLQSGTFSAFVGDSIGITCQVEAETYINGVAPTTGATVDFGNTLHLYAGGAGATPDAFLADTASGHSYSFVAVPEPSAAVLLLPMLVGGRLFRRRRR